MTLLTGYFGMNFTEFWSVNNNSDLFFWELAIPIIVAVTTVFMWGDFVRIGHYLQKRWIARNAVKPYSCRSTTAGYYISDHLRQELDFVRETDNARRTAAFVRADPTFSPRVHIPDVYEDEFVPLTHHYHPIIALHARQLLAGQPLTASADLFQNTFTHFLDHFVYKNPKKLKVDGRVAVSGKARGASAMQPAASGVDGTSVKLMRGEVPGVAPLVTDSAFLRKREEEVPVDEIFFHRYLTRKQRQKAKQEDGQDSEKESDAGEAEVESAAEDSGDDEDESGPFIDLSDDEQKEASQEKAVEDADEDEKTDDEEEAEIWKAMKASMPKAGDDDELDLMDDSDESDDVPSGLDGDNDDDGVPSGLDSDDGGEAAVSAASKSDDNAADSDDASEDLSLAEASDDDDLMPLDDAFGPDGVLEYDGSDSSGEEEDEWQGFSDDKKKRKRDAEGGEKRKKKKQRLPTFASYEDYAKMIDEAPEDNI
ncbi:hypothetical protein HDZ31DRAFT_67426 [Schizophyllum fasciatum]